MSPAPVLRHERKFVPEGISVPEFLSRLRRHPALFREIHHERPVNSLYFDSHDLRHYFDHIHGAADRLKVRLRWYGDFHGPAEPLQLELKARHGLAGSKEVFNLPPLDVVRSLGRLRPSSLAQFSHLPETVRLRLHTTEPTVANRYRRRYFISADGQVRLTVDWALEFLDPRHPDTGLRSANGAAPHLVIELKYDPTHADTAARIANAFPFRLGRCSKYVLGVEHVRGAFASGN